MGQLTITLPDDLEEEVRRIVQTGRYGSVSDFVREAIRGSLSAKPTYWERFIAAQTLENNKLLKLLVDENDVQHDEFLDALQRGYSSHYYNAENLVSNDELSREDASFVMDVLEMYSALQHACEVHKLSKKLCEKALFEGFDGNAGDGFLGYTNFLVDNGRFTYVKPLDKTPHLNSHCPVNHMYRRMLSAYKRIKNSQDVFEIKPLTPEEVSEIINEQIHPENRKEK